MTDTGGQCQGNYLTSAHFVSILDRGKDPFFTNTFHDSRGVPIPGPRGPPGPVGECLACLMNVYTVSLYVYLHE